MSIGYACLTVGIPNTSLKSCMLKNATEEKLLEIIQYNLNSLENIIDYNIKNNIRLFRISSDLIPFGSSVVNNLPWEHIFNSQFSSLGKKIKENGIRVSMHPGQYTVLNSPNVEVVSKAIDDLAYHNKVLNCLGMPSQHKIVLHIGGIYKDKTLAMNRFIANYRHLDQGIKQRLVLENDDKSYNIGDVLEIAANLRVPVIFDNLHNEINAYDKNKSPYYWIEQCKNTWSEEDGYQKIHYSQQEPLKKPGSHSRTIGINIFMDFYENLNRKDIDIMLEVKDKNLSAVKCINATSIEKNINVLEREWSRYKYKILENSHLDYLEIRKLLKNKEDYPAIAFYNLIEKALQKEITVGSAINAAQHLWGYFKDKASDKEKSSFLKNLENFNEGKGTINGIKSSLWKMAVKYQENYLLNSYYFFI